MNSIFNAFYLSLFISFARKIVDKVMVSIEHEIPVKSMDDSENYYVTVCGHFFVWEDDRDAALAWCFNAISNCRSLANKVGIVETAEEHCLEAAESIPGLTQEEVEGLNATVDSMD